jgi:nitric oxide reductase subunit B
MVSMAELWILFKIIWGWRHTLEKFSKLNHRQSCRLLFASEIWVLLNLVLALIMSVPAFNLITHGTHVTVAHAMGTTIGINSMILLASVFFVIEEHCAKEFHYRYETIMRWGAWITNASLGVFLGALLMAGIYEAAYTGEFFGDMMLDVQIYLMTFTAAGVGVLIGLWMLLFPSIRCLWFIQRS